MAQSSQVVQTKMLDYFFSLRNVHAGRLPADRRARDAASSYEYECLFRPSMPVLPQSISAIVQAAIDTGPVGRARRVHRPADPGAGRRARGRRAGRPASRRSASRSTSRRRACSTASSRRRRSRRWSRRPGSSPRQITLECTEQQAVPDVGPLVKRQVKALRRLGFGFAIDDAGAGYASFTPDRRPPPVGHQDRPRDRLRHRPRRREAGARRGVRVVRRPDRRAAPRRGHRAPGGPGDADRASASTRPGLSHRQAGATSRSRRGRSPSCGRTAPRPARQQRAASATSSQSAASDRPAPDGARPSETPPMGSFNEHPAPARSSDEPIRASCCLCRDPVL